MYVGWSRKTSSRGRHLSQDMGRETAMQLSGKHSRWREEAVEDPKWGQGISKEASEAGAVGPRRKGRIKSEGCRMDGRGAPQRAV